MPVTLKFATGFGHGISVVGAAATGGLPIWDSVIGTPSVVTTPIRIGNRALEISASAAAENLVITQTGRRVIMVGYVQFASLPTGTNCTVLGVAVAGGDLSYIGVNTGGKWISRCHSGGSLVTDSVGPSTGATWYRVEFDLNTEANPWTLDWKIDGVAKTQATFAAAAADVVSVRFGTALSSTTTFYLADVAYSVTAGDFPIGSIYIKGYQPVADGTHSNQANFEDAGNAAISAGNPAWDQMDAVPLSSLTEYVTETAVGTGDYVEVAFDNSTEGKDPIHVQAHVAMSADTATGNHAAYKIRDGSTDLAIFDGDPSQTSDIFRTLAMATKPSGGAWTETALNALLFRFGYSSDANPDPHCGGVMVEAVFAVAAAGPANLKTWNGLAKASIKTIDGLALASVKTVDGLT